MGEAVICCKNLEIENEEEEEEEYEEQQQGKEIAKKRNRFVMKWEQLLPRMVLRVLLVEADDSTRQIVAALLRKCSYKVMAVPDGLKAWEILKGRTHNIDLILTEVDLPSISGYALLTLIMEHEICKNIPVIMMSSQDSVRTVYNCMLKGAADYLVKPVRINELRNLWQHVWRRQSSTAGGNGPQDESVGQDKVEATSENNAASNHSSGNMACIQNNKEFIEKGSDAQSSCAKPDGEAKSASMQDFFQPLWGKVFPSGINMQDRLLQQNEAEVESGSDVAFCNQITVHKDVEQESQRMSANITREACDNNHVLVNSSREAIDFMGTSSSHNYSSDNVKSKFNFSPHLDLCLTRCHPGGFEIQGTEGRHTLRHSNASAFTRYTNRPSQHSISALASVQNEADSERKLSGDVRGYNSDTPSPAPITERSNISVANAQRKQSEIATSCPQQRVFPVPIPVNGISFNNPCTSYGSLFPPTFCKQSSASPIPSPSLGSQPEPNSKVNSFLQSNFRSNSEHLYDRFRQTANDSTNLSLQKQDRKLDSLEDRGHISSATDQSATGSFCIGAVNHLNIGYKSTSGSITAAADRQNEEGILQNTNSHRSIQREAALTKFRLKRKDRCYEKKVRYESRKKLAEQRPRVKGQFVRQANPLSSEAEQ